MRPQQNRFSIWIEATRPKTLPAALCPVLIGSACAAEAGAFDWRAAVLCLLFAGLIQIGTNFANDYLDGVKGTDTDRRLGPVRAVASGLVAPEIMRAAAIVVLALAFLFGLGLIPFGGWSLLGVGLASVACAWLYTGGPYPLAYNGLGDVFVILFFGFIAVGFTYFVQAEMITADVLAAALACGLLINNLLVINNYRDFEEDRMGNKRTLVVRFGRRFGQSQYLLSTVIAAVVTSYLALSGYGLELLVALLPLVLSLRIGLRLGRLVSPGDYLRALKQSGLVVALYGLFFSLGVIF